MLILEQFADLPVIIVAGPQMNGNNMPSYPVVILEKARGRMIYNRSVQNNGIAFQNITVNVKNGTIEMNRFDVRIRISADDPPRTETP
jgi:leucyl aminopeptidase (aminopeptidase T)